MPRKPNLLFIFTDEQRFDTMECYGNTSIQTPNLNALARESFVFENAYVSQPVCTPSRATIMTGMYPQTHGLLTNNVVLAPETRTIAEMVSKEYLCGYYGKWHLGNEVMPQHGFERWRSIDDGYRPWYSRTEHLARSCDYVYFLIENGFTPDSESEDGPLTFSRAMAADLPVEFTKASYLARESARFIRDNRVRPFVLYVNFLEPHMPFTGPLNDIHPRDELNTGPHFFKRPPSNASGYHRARADEWLQAEFEGHDLSTEAGWREMRARYFGNVSLVDRAVGEILGALEESGLSDDTIVVFTSEHGEMMGDHGILGKGVLYEESVKVPLIARVPWLAKEGSVLRGRVGLVDLVPTLLDLMGQPIPDELDGESRVPVLRGESTLEANDVFFQWNGPEGGDIWRSVVSSDGWKLNLSPEDQCELYDLNGDPYEQTNLYDDPAHKNRVRDLASRIRQWQERVGDRTGL